MKLIKLTGNPAVRLDAEATVFLKMRRGRNFRQLFLAGTIFASMAAYPAFQYWIDVPAGTAGASRTATVTYSNDGTAAIAAPYVRLEAGANAFVRFSESDAWSKSVEFLATSDQSPASSLRAGESVEIPVFVYTTTQQAQMTFSYTQSSTEAFPWSDIGASLKPSRRVNPGEVFMGDAYPRIGLGILKEDVVPGFVMLYQVVFKEEGIGFARHYGILGVSYFGHQYPGFGVQA